MGSVATSDVTSRPEVATFVARAEERGCVSLSELDELIQTLDLSDEEVDALLGRARARIAETVAGLRAGEVRPCPERCGPAGSCSYPGICREPEAA